MGDKEKAFQNSLAFKIFLILLGGFLFYVLTNFQDIKNTLNNLSETNHNLTFKDCDETKAISKVKNSVVRVKANEGEGTGFFVKPNFVATNYHIVQGSSNIKIIDSTNTLFNGMVYAWDEEVDIALVKLDGYEHNPLAYGDSNLLSQGQTLIGIGFPLGEALPGEATVTKGIYSAKRESDKAGVEYIQIDANLNKGNSGSPIINSCGDVIGILALGISGAEGLKFAIASKTASPITESLLAGNEMQHSETVPLSYGNESELLNAVVQYYDFVSTRQLDMAFETFSRNFKRETGEYENFVRGFDTTLNVYLNEIQLEYSSPNSVYIEITAADLVDDKVLFRKFAGTWRLIKENGVWKLDDPNISQTPIDL